MRRRKSVPTLTAPHYRRQISDLLANHLTRMLQPKDTSQFNASHKFSVRNRTLQLM